MVRPLVFNGGGPVATAGAETTETVEEAVEVEPQTVTFESKGTHLRLIRVDAIVGMTPQGQAYNAAEPTYVDFEPRGVVTFAVGDQTLPDGPVLYEGGRMVLDPLTKQPVRAEQDAITWLLQHREFGVQFWVKGLQPGTPLPLEGEFTAAVFDAMMRLELRSLERMRDAELRTHGRPVLMAVVENALSRVAAAREQAGDDVVDDPEDADIPVWNEPGDLVRRPVNMRDQDAAAAQAAALASPDDPAYAGGV